MKVGRLIGDALKRIPGIGGWVERLRFGLRRGRRTRWSRRGGGSERRYAEWVRRVDTPTPAELQSLRARATALHTRPVMSLLVVDAADAALLDRALVALCDQGYAEWEASIVAVDPPATVRAVIDRHVAGDARMKVQRVDRAATGAARRNAALEVARGDFVMVLGAADVLPPQALFRIAEAVERHPDAALVYADEDRIDAAGTRREPWFKGDLNRELLLAHDAISRPAAYSRRLLRELDGWREGFAGAEDYDLALRVVDAVGPARVVHVPRILCHRGPSAADDAAGSLAEADAGRRAVADLLRRRGSAAVVEPAAEAPGCNRVRHPLPAPPLVSIIVCTRDHERLLRRAVDSIAARTTYPRYEILVVDNGSEDPAAVAHLAELASRPGMRVLRDDAPFNYPRLNNRAAAAARGEVLCLLNDDVEVLTPGWLDEMVAHAVRPDVGAVGARLWYPDGTLQHGGVVVGIGRAAGHAHPRLGRGEPGHFGRAVLQQDVTAVTAACLVVRKEVYAAMSGLDERLEVALNDVDFCLRLRAAGYRVIWTPYAELVHHESASRGVDDTPAKRARWRREIDLMLDRWGDAFRRDPFYNPNLSHAAADFSIDAPPR